MSADPRRVASPSGTGGGAKWTPREYLRQLAEGCKVHGTGFICRHTWDDLEGPAFDGDVAPEYNAARARLARAALVFLADCEAHDAR